MTEENTDAAAAAASEAPKPVRMQVLGQFVRDMSFENILSQRGTAAEGQPDVQVAVSLDAKKREAEHQYEIIQKYKITSKAKGGDDVYFVMELDYGAIFHVENVPEEQLHPFLLIECPRMVFPFARRIVSDVTRDGGFPPLNLDTVDFMALYRQEIARRAQAEAEGVTPS